MGIDSRIKATTGFQTRGYTHDELTDLLTQRLQTEDKELEYTQTSLRSAYEIYKDGGHVTMVYNERIFRLHYDNRRVIDDSSYNTGSGYENLITDGISKVENAIVDVSNVLLDSRPVQDITRCKNQRFLSKIAKLKIYNRETSQSSTMLRSRYKGQIELAIRTLLKGLLSTPTMFNLGVNPFNNYEEIVDYINSYPNKGNLRISKYSLSKLRNRTPIFKSVPKTKETLDFVEFVKEKFPNFDAESFFTRF